MDPFATLDDDDPDQHGEDDDETVAGTERRRFAALLIDTSDSMRTTVTGGIPAVDALNRRIATWLPQIRAAGRDSLRDTEFVVITFGAGGVLVASGDGTPSAEDGGAFVPASRLDVPALTAAGATPMVAAIDLALHLLQERRDRVRRLGQRAGAPCVVLVTDGAPTDFEGNPCDGWRELAGRLEHSRAVTGIRLFAFGVPGVNDEVLRALAGDDGCFRLDDLDLGKLLARL